MIKRQMPRNLGFTLLETLLAIVILSSGLMLLTQSWSGGFLRVQKTQAQFEIAALLERKMTEIELEYRGKNLEEIPEERSEDFGDKYPQYKWIMKSKALDIPDLSGALGAQDGGADPMTLSVIKQLTDGLSKMVKEVTVTVILNTPNSKSGKPLEYSVTTYFVDYDKDVQFGMPQ